MSSIETSFRIVELAVSCCTLMTLAWGLLRMFKSAREAKATRAEALVAANAAAAAAALAAEHAVATASVVAVMAENVQKIELASNSMKDALVAATDKAAGLAGEIRGREQEIKRQEEKS